ncbi:hypothetical protein EGK58_011080 [Acinetobacter variabilis]|uniref:Uncharacterized protein n=2 Tax=Acinetobacter variabilis TaxID=70346 RepID=A0A8F6M329_9GAMM|nr:hypothetical protein [Acinetobacter variabilis]QXR18626.1 hypothetical protein EGK58_011080 [Acinetobacter variabilis]
MNVAVDEPLESFSWFSTTDIYLFSLIIFLSISNELKHVISSEIEIEKKIGYICDTFIVALAILLGLAFLNDAKTVMNINLLLILAIFMALVSSIFGIGSLYLIDEKLKESTGEKA